MNHRIILIRHGKTDSNINKTYTGAQDIPLADEGARELLKLKKSGFYPEADIVISSPMKRCRETVEIIYPEADVVYDSSFREYDFGEFEGKSYEDLKDNPDYILWIASGGEVSAPFGEDIEDFENRCRNGLLYRASLMKEGQTLAIICHGGVIMRLMTIFANSNKTMFDWSVANAKGYALDFNSETNKFENIELL